MKFSELITTEDQYEVNKARAFLSLYFHEVVPELANIIGFWQMVDHHD